MKEMGFTPAKAAQAGDEAARRLAPPSGRTNTPPQQKNVSPK